MVWELILFLRRHFGDHRISTAAKNILIFIVCYFLFSLIMILVYGLYSLQIVKVLIYFTFEEPAFIECYSDTQFKYIFVNHSWLKTLYMDKLSSNTNYRARTWYG